MIGQTRKGPSTINGGLRRKMKVETGRYQTRVESSVYGTFIQSSAERVRGLGHC